MWRVASMAIEWLEHSISWYLSKPFVTSRRAAVKLFYSGPNAHITLHAVLHTLLSTSYCKPRSFSGDAHSRNEAEQPLTRSNRRYSYQTRRPAETFAAPKPIEHSSFASSKENVEHIETHLYDLLVGSGTDLRQFSQPSNKNVEDIFHSQRLHSTNKPKTYTSECDFLTSDSMFSRSANRLRSSAFSLSSSMLQPGKVHIAQNRDV